MLGLIDSVALAPLALLPLCFQAQGWACAPGSRWWLPPESGPPL
jgi:hypothetical protein